VLDLNIVYLKPLGYYALLCEYLTFMAAHASVD
jgi:hypothetical protein